jgi:hypothetical protein
MLSGWPVSRVHVAYGALVHRGQLQAFAVRSSVLYADGSAHLSGRGDAAREDPRRGRNVPVVPVCMSTDS